MKISHHEYSVKSLAEEHWCEVVISWINFYLGPNVNLVKNLLSLTIVLFFLFIFLGPNTNASFADNKQQAEAWSNFLVQFITSHYAFWGFDRLKQRSFSWVKFQKLLWGPKRWKCLRQKKCNHSFCQPAWPYKWKQVGKMRAQKGYEALWAYVRLSCWLGLHQSVLSWCLY